MLRHEMNWLEYLARKEVRCTPRHIGHGWCLDDDFCYLLTTGTNGTPLSWGETVPERPMRDKVLKQLALLQEHILERTASAPWPDESSRYGMREGVEQFFLDRARSTAGHLENQGDTAKYAPRKYHRKARLWLPELHNEPHTLDHGNICGENIVVDSDYNITCIIDWRYASHHSVQLAAGLPACLLSGKGFAHAPPTASMLEDRKVYIDALDDRDSKAARWIKMVQTPENCKSGAAWVCAAMAESGLSDSEKSSSYAESSSDKEFSREKESLSDQNTISEEQTEEESSSVEENPAELEPEVQDGSEQVSHEDSDAADGGDEMDVSDDE